MSNNECSGNEYSDKAWHNEGVLRELYHDEGLSMGKIAERLGCHAGTIQHWMEKHEIPRRGRRERPNEETPWRDKDTLSTLLNDEGYTQVEIAEKFGVSKEVINRWVTTHDLNPKQPWQDPDKLRPYYQDHSLTVGEIAEKLGCDRSTISTWARRHGFERRHAKRGDIVYKSENGESGEPPWRDANVLEDLYHTKGLTLDEVGDRLGCEAGTVGKWLENHDIPARTPTDYASDNPWRESEVLYELYVEQGLGMGEIADELGCGKATVQKNLYRHGIDTRERGGFDPNARYRDEDLLKEYYAEKGYSIAHTARILGGSTPNVRRWLMRYGLADESESHSTFVEVARRWLGDEPWDRMASRLVEERGDVCQMCGKEGNHNGRSVCGHHVIPIIHGGSNFDAGIQLLCDECHRKAEKYAMTYTDFSIAEFDKSE